ESERLAERGAELFDFIGGRGRHASASPQEEVEDFISDRANYFPRLEAAADVTRASLVADPSPALEALARHLDRRHRIQVRRVSASEAGPGMEARSPDRRAVLPAGDLARPPARFRPARPIRTIEPGDLPA